MAHLQYVDELVKEYLLFRGFNQSLRALDSDLKVDKEKGFRVDRFVDQIMNHIQTYDLVGLRELWAHLDRRIFCRLPHLIVSCVRKLETSLLRLYVVNTIQTGKQEKLLEFFEKMSPELQNQSDWKEWFILPYLKGVEENTTFAMFFSRQWQDTLLVSLHNFLSVVFQSMELPTLANYKDEANCLSKLQEENDLLRARLAAVTASDRLTLDELSVPDPPPPSHLMDDFFNIAQETPSMENQTRSLKTILLSLGTNSSVGFARRNVAENSETKLSSVTSADSVVNTNDKTIKSFSLNEEKKTGKSIQASNTPGGGSNEAITKKVFETTNDRSVTSMLVDDDAFGDGTNDIGSFILLGREEFCEHRTVVTHTMFSPSGSLVASADADGVVKLWSPSPNPAAIASVVLKSGLTSVEWLPHGDRFLLLATKSAILRLYDVTEKKNVWEIGPEGCSVFKDQRIMSVAVNGTENKAVVSVSPRTRSVTSYSSVGAGSPSLRVLDLKTLKVETSLRLDGVIVNNCTTNHNGGLLVCGCNDGSVRIVDLRCPDPIASWGAHQGETFTVRLSPDENSIYTIGSDNRFACWSVRETGTKLFDQIMHERAAGPFLMAPAGGVSGRSVLLRPYGPLFAVHHENGDHIMACSASGPVLYKAKSSGLEVEVNLGGHTSPVVTVDWCSALQCGLCVAGGLDGVVTVATLMPH